MPSRRQPWVFANILFRHYALSRPPAAWKALRGDPATLARLWDLAGVTLAPMERTPWAAETVFDTDEPWLTAIVPMPPSRIPGDPIEIRFAWHPGAPDQAAYVVVEAADGRWAHARVSRWLRDGSCEQLGEVRCGARVDAPSSAFWSWPQLAC